MTTIRKFVSLQKRSKDMNSAATFILTYAISFALVGQALAASYAP